MELKFVSKANKSKDDEFKLYLYGIEMSNESTIYEYFEFKLYLYGIEIELWQIFLSFLCQVQIVPLWN